MQPFPSVQLQDCVLVLDYRSTTLLPKNSVKGELQMSILSDYDSVQALKRRLAIALEALVFFAASPGAENWSPNGGSGFDCKYWLGEYDRVLKALRVLDERMKLQSVNTRITLLAA